MAPKDVKKDDEQEIYDNKYDKYIETKIKISVNFNIGDKVRVLKQRKNYIKNYITRSQPNLL